MKQNFQGEQPNIMTINGFAVYNEEKQIWEVEINQSSLAKTFPSEEYRYWKENKKFQVEACDELVFVNSLIKMNGMGIVDYEKEVEKVKEI